MEDLWAFPKNNNVLRCAEIDSHSGNVYKQSNLFSLACARGSMEEFMSTKEIHARISRLSLKFYSKRNYDARAGQNAKEMLFLR